MVVPERNSLRLFWGTAKGSREFGVRSIKMSCVGTSFDGEAGLPN
jgi:hypothetical protein